MSAEGGIGDTNRTSGTNAGWRDPLCLLLVSAVCSAAYVLGLRRYSDDWFFVEPLATSADQSWSGLYHTLAATPFVGVRPVQILWYIAFHKLAPGNVVLVHVANHLVFAASSLILYLALRVTRATRRGAYYIALLYMCLPTFSVAKMWYANHQAVLSLLMFAATWWLVARFALARRWILIPVIAVTAAIGNLAYELFSIAALALPLFVWWAFGTGPRELLRDRAFVAAMAAVSLGFVATTLFKLTYGYGIELPPSIRTGPQYAWSAAWMYFSAARTTFWTLGVYSPRAAMGILTSPYLQPGAIWAPLAALAIMAAREWLVRRGNKVEDEARPAFFAVSGLIAFGLGYAPYLTNFLYSPKPWGEGNRANIAAALGAALLIYAAFRWLHRRWPAIATVALLTFCTIGAFLQVAIGLTWVRAADEQDRLFARFESIVRQGLADRGTVLVYGTCPYYGAGPVFPYGWDLQARLATETKYRNLAIGLVEPQMIVGDEGLAMPRSRWGEPFYRYGALHVVDMASGTLTPLASRNDASRFFTTHPLAESITCEFDFGVGNPLY